MVKVLYKKNYATVKAWRRYLMYKVHTELKQKGK